MSIVSVMLHTLVFLLDEHLHQWQPACPSNKTVSIVSVMLHTLIFCWMSIFQPTATSLDSKQGSVDSVNCIRAEMDTLMLDDDLNDRSSTSHIG